jgi:hypothetical protein
MQRVFWTDNPEVYEDTYKIGISGDRKGWKLKTTSAGLQYLD